MCFQFSPGIYVFPRLNILQRDLDHLDTPWNSTLIHYIGGSVLVGLDEQEIAGTSEAFIIYVCSRE